MAKMKFSTGKMQQKQAPRIQTVSETVVFSWIRWPSREVRDAGWKTVMADPHMADAERTIPFDGRRLIYGGFEVLLQA